MLFFLLISTDLCCIAYGINIFRRDIYLGFIDWISLKHISKREWHNMFENYKPNSRHQPPFGLPKIEFAPLQ
jgi:hypothetical protein